MGRNKRNMKVQLKIAHDNNSGQQCFEGSHDSSRRSSADDPGDASNVENVNIEPALMKHIRKIRNIDERVLLWDINEQMDSQANEHLHGSVNVEMVEFSMRSSPFSGYLKPQIQQLRGVSRPGIGGVVMVDLVAERRPVGDSGLLSVDTGENAPHQCDMSLPNQPPNGQPGGSEPGVSSSSLSLEKVEQTSLSPGSAVRTSGRSAKKNYRAMVNVPYSVASRKSAAAAASGVTEVKVRRKSGKKKMSETQCKGDDLLKEDKTSDALGEGGYQGTSREGSGTREDTRVSEEANAKIEEMVTNEEEEGEKKHNKDEDNEKEEKIKEDEKEEDVEIEEEKKVNNEEEKKVNNKEEKKVNNEEEKKDNNEEEKNEGEELKEKQNGEQEGNVEIRAVPGEVMVQVGRVQKGTKRRTGPGEGQSAAKRAARRPHSSLEIDAVWPSVAPIEGEGGRRRREVRPPLYRDYVVGDGRAVGRGRPREEAVVASQETVAVVSQEAVQEAGDPARRTRIKQAIRLGGDIDLTGSGTTTVKVGGPRVKQVSRLAGLPWEGPAAEKGPTKGPVGKCGLCRHCLRRRACGRCAACLGALPGAAREAVCAKMVCRKFARPPRTSAKEARETREVSEDHIPASDPPKVAEEVERGKSPMAAEEGAAAEEEAAAVPRRGVVADLDVYRDSEGEAEGPARPGSEEENIDPGLSLADGDEADPDEEGMATVKAERLSTPGAHEGGYPVATSRQGMPAALLCYSCGSGDSQMIHCVSCAEPFHFFCIEFQFRPKSKEMFVCRNCTRCHLCDNHGSDLKCIKCQLGFHPACVDRYPPSKSDDRSNWACYMCAMCLHCGTKAEDVMGEGAGAGGSGRLPQPVDWGRDPWQCGRCSRARKDGQVCPECGRAYQAGLETVDCLRCRKQVHRQCAGLTEDEYEVHRAVPDGHQEGYECGRCARVEESGAARTRTRTSLGRSCKQGGLKMYCERQVAARTADFLRRGGVREEALLEARGGLSGLPTVGGRATQACDQLDGVVDDEDQDQEDARDSCDLTSPTTSADRDNPGGLALCNSSESVEEYDVDLLTASDMEPRTAVPVDLDDAPLEESSPARVKVGLFSRLSPEDFLTPRHMLLEALARINLKLGRCPSQSSVFETYTSLLEDLESLCVELFPWLDFASCLDNVQEVVRAYSGRGKLVLRAVADLVRDGLRREEEVFSASVWEIEDKLRQSLVRGREEFIIFHSEQHLMALMRTLEASGDGDLENGPNRHVFKYEAAFPGPGRPSVILEVDGRRCTLCHLGGDDGLEGRLLHVRGDIWLHVNCALWSDEVYEGEDGGLANVPAALARGRGSRCAACGVAGATLRCAGAACLLCYHFGCAFNRLQAPLFTEERRFFCCQEGRDESPGGRAAKDGGLGLAGMLILRRVFVPPPPGKARLPIAAAAITVGALRVERLGGLSAFCDQARPHLAPLGYRARRLFWSGEELDSLVMYQMAVRGDPAASQGPLGLGTGPAVAQERQAAPKRRRLMDTGPSRPIKTSRNVVYEMDDHGNLRPASPGLPNASSRHGDRRQGPATLRVNRRFPQGHHVPGRGPGRPPLPTGTVAASRQDQCVSSTPAGSQGTVPSSATMAMAVSRQEAPSSVVPVSLMASRQDRCTPSASSVSLVTVPVNPVSIGTVTVSRQDHSTSLATPVFRPVAVPVSMGTAPGPRPSSRPIIPLATSASLQRPATVIRVLPRLSAVNPSHFALRRAQVVHRPSPTVLRTVLTAPPRLPQATPHRHLPLPSPSAAQFRPPASASSLSSKYVISGSGSLIRPLPAVGSTSLPCLPQTDGQYDDDDDCPDDVSDGDETIVSLKPPPGRSGPGLLRFVIEGFTSSRSPKSAWTYLVRKVARMRAASGFNRYPLKTGDGWAKFGLDHRWVAFLIEQLPGAALCLSHDFKFHKAAVMKLRQQPVQTALHRGTGCSRARTYQSMRPAHVVRDPLAFLGCKSNLAPRSLAPSTPAPTATSPEPTPDADYIQNLAVQFRNLRSGVAARAKNVCVRVSGIHGRGLFARREFSAHEVIIEYVGETIRAVLSDVREVAYQRSGVDCYMFRLDRDLIVDATCSGNAARFINHSCQPNCYAKVVKLEGDKHIVIIGHRRIYKGEELTYDYRFPLEDEKLPCTCGSRQCRKYLN